MGYRRRRASAENNTYFKMAVWPGFTMLQLIVKYFSSRNTGSLESQISEDLVVRSHPATTCPDTHIQSNSNSHANTKKINSYLASNPIANTRAKTWR
jgi:hypothetical protein